MNDAVAPTDTEQGTEDDLKARAEELNKGEEALVERGDRLAERELELDKREATLAARDNEPALEPVEGVSYAALPDPQTGNGFVVVEAPLPLVTVFAALHPSERGAVSAQVAGAMRQVLLETGKLRGGHTVPEDEDLVELAIVANPESA